jgi:hypothetical protein
MASERRKNHATSAPDATNAARVGDVFGHESATAIPVIAESATPRNGWRGHALSSFMFRGEVS